MKKITVFLLLCFLLQTVSLTASVVPSVGNPAGKENAYKQKVEVLKKIAAMDVKEFEAFTGKHMNFIERALFKIEQKKLNNSIDQAGNVTNKKLDKYLRKSSDNSSGFHLGGFALGFLLGLIGVLIAYVAFKDDNKQNRIKWAWIGTGVIVAISIILRLAFL